MWAGCREQSMMAMIAITNCLLLLLLCVCLCLTYSSAGAADKACHVWGMQHILPGANSSSNGCSSVTQPSHLLASQCKPAAVGAMAFDPVAELLCAGHSDGVVSIWNCCYSTTQCGTIFE